MIHLRALVLRKNSQEARSPSCVDVIEIAEVVGGADEVDQDVWGRLAGGVEGVAVNQRVQAVCELLDRVPQAG